MGIETFSKDLGATQDVVQTVPCASVQGELHPNHSWWLFILCILTMCYQYRFQNQSTNLHKLLQ